MDLLEQLLVKREGVISKHVRVLVKKLMAVEAYLKEKTV